jgi:hypothetical protein
MEVSLSELERVEAILDELKGNEAAHGKAGLLQVDRSALELNVTDMGAFEQNLPDVLKAVVTRLRARASEENDGVARTALCHLYRTVREASR